MQAAVDVRTLGISGSDLLGSGAEGYIFRVPKGEAAMPLALKLYRPEVLQEVGHVALGMHLDRLIETMRAADDAAQKTILKHIAWPLRRVEEAGRTVGFLMARIPPQYRESYDFDMLGTPKHVTTDATFAFVCNEDARRHSMGLPTLNALGRAKVAHDCLELATALHHLGVVMGDISEKNILVHVDTGSQVRNSVLFIDADSYRLKRLPSPLKQGHTPHWIPPESLAAARRHKELIRAGQKGRETDLLGHREMMQGEQTDVYKLSLLLFRLYYLGEHRLSFTAENGAARRSVVARVDAEVGPVFRQALMRGLDSNPAKRPTLLDLRESFARSLNERSTNRERL